MKKATKNEAEASFQFLVFLPVFLKGSVSVASPENQISRKDLEFLFPDFYRPRRRNPQLFSANVD